MFKATPNPPSDIDPTDKTDQTDPVSPYASVDSKKLHDAAHRALDFYLNPKAEKSRNSVDRGMQMFKVDPDINPEASPSRPTKPFPRSAFCCWIWPTAWTTSRGIWRWRSIS